MASASGPPSRPTKVLFVDDEPAVLRSIDRVLRAKRTPFEARFVDRGRAALDLLAAEEFDVIVSDLKMPEMDGLTLLRQVRQEFPSVARLILSGQVGMGEGVWALQVASQVLAKPYNVSTLRHAIQRLTWLRSLVGDRDIIGLTGQLPSLPSPPQTYANVTEAIRRQAPMREISRLVEVDQALTAKLLQLANSAAFGIGSRVTSVERALSALGTELTSCLLLGTEVFRSFERSDLQFDQQALQRHSLKVAAVARSLAPPELAAEAFAAGVLHDIGDLVLASFSRPPSGHVDHGRLGGLLLGSWGLSDELVDAIAFHHDPAASALDPYPPLLEALYVAERVVGELAGDDSPIDPVHGSRVSEATWAKARAAARDA